MSSYENPLIFTGVRNTENNDKKVLVNGNSWESLPCFTFITGSSAGFEWGYGGTGPRQLGVSLATILFLREHFHYDQEDYERQIRRDHSSPEPAENFFERRIFPGHEIGYIGQIIEEGFIKNFPQDLFDEEWTSDDWEAYYVQWRVTEIELRDFILSRLQEERA